MKCQKGNRILLKTVKKARPRHNPFSAASGLLPVSCHDLHAAALEPCAAAVRTAPLIPGDSFFLFVPRAMWELSQGFTFAIVWLRDASGTTGTTETTGTLERLELATGYVKVVSTDSQEISKRLDDRVCGGT